VPMGFQQGLLHDIGSIELVLVLLSQVEPGQQQQALPKSLQWQVRHGLPFDNSFIPFLALRRLQGRDRQRRSSRTRHALFSRQKENGDAMNYKSRRLDHKRNWSRESAHS